MKKFIFTAIAMVAFMGSSMASTIEKKSTNSQDQSLKRLEKCEVVAMALVELFEQETGVCDDSGHLYNFIKANCEKS